MSFPVSPSNSQTVVLNNITYSYSTSTNAWTRVATGGAQGITGSQGTQGVGSQGTTGSQGVQGVQGSQGVQGTAIQGVQGLAGNVQGTTGSQGVQGVQGSQGLQGLQGVQGVQGASIQGTSGVNTALTSTYVGFGSGSNTLTGSSNLTWNGSTLSVTGNLTDGTIISKIAQDYVVSVTANSATTTLDLSQGNTFYVTISASTTFAFSNVPTGSNLTNFSIITYNSAGGYAISWPASVTWAGAQTPARTTASGKSDIYTFFTLNAGTNIIGSLSILNY